MTDLNVELPDGSVRALGEGSSALDLAKAIGSRLAKDALAARVNGVMTDLSTPLVDGDRVAIVTPASDDGREVLRHSSAHVMAQAVVRLWPGAHYAIGPAINDGFYYDFELPGGAHFSDDDLVRVDAEMRAIIAEEQPFLRAEYSIDEGLAIFKNQPFKIEIIEAVAHGGSDEDLAETGSNTVVSTYSNTSAFVDLCRGPHVPTTARLGHFQLTRVAGAYWRGDETKTQLQRIYGTAWESKDALAAHVAQLAEAEKRDHRRLGHELDLFSFPSEIGPGLAVFHPKGGIIRRVLEEYSRHRHEVSGYEFVYSPHISKADLFETSGHLTWFAESMYPPMVLDEGQRYYLKPMNCPFHVLIFKARQRSYRELPLRMFEFGSVYRYEKSGVVQGLTRVRGMTQDDAHIFCTREQMADELASLLSFVLDLLRDFGLNEFYLKLSTRPPGKAVGSDEEWAEAETTLASVANAAGLDLVHDPGGGAFYGPKISVQARDAIGRTHQMSTIQLDFQTPANFDATYVSPDNARERPIMIHRALFGSVERFMAILIEHYAGNLPTWLCPEQVRVLGVRDDHDDYAFEVAELLRAVGVRVSVEAAAEPLGARIRKAKLEKIPYVVVVGDDDVEKGTLGINARGSNDPDRGVSVGVFLERLVDEIERHASPEAPVPLERFSAAWREEYVSSAFAGELDKDSDECVFCLLASEPVNESSGVLKKTASTFVVLNAFPYGSGHLLVLPIRHVGAIEELSDTEYQDFFFVLRDTIRALNESYGADGMNVGMNLGHAAGAGIPKHLHAHALPRWLGDTNFMTTIGETRVLPESLQSTWRKVHAHL